jgi:hypothetical protein
MASLIIEPFGNVTLLRRVLFLRFRIMSGSVSAMALRLFLGAVKLELELAADGEVIIRMARLICI